MLPKSSWIDNNIIHEDFDKVLKRSKYSIDLSLNVWRRSLVAHERDSRFLLFAIADNDEFISIASSYEKLMKLVNGVNNR